ncbi:DnaJ domain-containing protein [Hahella sp. SMD15-11]|uniref:DnaJ domain-containing protein n=1 Tax=Thermohahella caldifontis TaxID=3142973 RepID=A0AB39UVY4_9GAMM
MRTGYQWGAFWGFMTGGPIGALIGGYWGDRWQRWFEQLLPDIRIHLGSRPLDSDTLCTALGALTEGQLPPAVAESLIRHLGHHARLSEADVLAGLGAYDRGVADPAQFDGCIRNLYRRHAADPEALGLIAFALLQAAWLQGNPDARQRDKLERMRRAFHIPAAVFRQWETTVRAHFEQDHPESDLDTAYRTLELPPGASFAEVRQAYRRLMSRYHPDKWAHQSDPAAEARYKQQAQAIQQAYARLKRHLNH